VRSANTMMRKSTAHCGGRLRAVGDLRCCARLIENDIV
jgi:hypothetical protein